MTSTLELNRLTQLERTANRLWRTALALNTQEAWEQYWIAQDAATLAWAETEEQ